MPNHNTKPLGDLLQLYIRKFGHEDKFYTAKLNNNWDKIIGKLAAQNTRCVEIKGQRLFITVKSATLKHELHFLRENLINRTNQLLGQAIIREIIIK